MCGSRGTLRQTVLLGKKCIISIDAMGRQHGGGSGSGPWGRVGVPYRFQKNEGVPCHVVDEWFIVCVCSQALPGSHLAEEGERVLYFEEGIYDLDAEEGRPIELNMNPSYGVATDSLESDSLGTVSQVGGWKETGVQTGWKVSGLYSNIKVGTVGPHPVFIDL